MLSIICDSVDLSNTLYKPLAVIFLEFLNAFDGELGFRFLRHL